jgi:hypothetical protein
MEQTEAERQDYCYMARINGLKGRTMAKRELAVDPRALLGSVTLLDPDLTRPVVGPEDWEAAS